MPVFCFSDIEGSTQLWEKNGSEMPGVIARHNAILEQAVTRFGGRVIKHTGDGIYAIFEDGESQPLESALEAQKRLQAESWGSIGELRVRMAFHRGEAEKVNEDYYGPVANRTARLMALGWGGQILLSSELKKTAKLPEGATVVDLGVHRVKDLPEAQQVWGLLHPDLKLKKFPPLKSLDNRPHNLPQPVSPFVGREKELEQISVLLADPACRLLTLLAPGGMGKTRLSIQASEAALPRFKHGVYFVALAPVGSAEEIVGKIAEALGLTFFENQEPPMQQLAGYLADREILLVLDNFEHVVEGSGLLSELLQGCPKLRMIVTSRERLNLYAESVLELAGLELPAVPDAAGFDQIAAVQLFVQAATRSKPDFRIKVEDRPALVRLCALVACMPLGLELAASWVRVFGIQEIAKRIEQDLTMLSSTRKDLPERHRSIRAVFDYSWNLLGPEEQKFLALQSVFRGGFTLEAAEEVTGVELSVLATLVDKSLIRLQPGGRYETHELIAQFCQQKLMESAGASENILERHGRYYCRFLEQRRENIRGRGQKQAGDEIQADYENILQAWAWAIEQGRLEELSQAAEALGMYLQLRGHLVAGVALLSRALRKIESLEGGPGSLAHGRTLMILLELYQERGHEESALKFAYQALEILEKLSAKREMAYVLTHIPMFGGGKPPGHPRPTEEAIALFREIGDDNGAAYASQSLGFTWQSAGDPRTARTLFEESLATFLECGNLRHAAWSHMGLASLAKEAGDLEGSLRHRLEARRVFCEVGDTKGAAWADNCLGYDALLRGDLSEAEPLLVDSLAAFVKTGALQGVLIAHKNLAALYQRQSRWDEMRKAFTLALKIARQTDDRYSEVGLAEQMRVAEESIARAGHAH